MVIKNRIYYRLRTMFRRNIAIQHGQNFFCLPPSKFATKLSNAGMDFEGYVSIDGRSLLNNEQDGLICFASSAKEIQLLPRICSH